MEDKANGHGRGRAVPELPEHTFRDSGITIRIRKVGPMTQQRLAEAIMREIADAEPPRNPPESEAAQLGEEFNVADPAYIAAQETVERKRGLALNTRLLKYAALEAEVDLDAAAKAEIKRVRRHLQMIGIPFEDDVALTADENDRICYILHVACATTDDLKEFGQAIQQRSIPTEEAVQRHIATFPSDVPGA